MPISLLHPKYFLTWFGFFVLWSLAKLPMSVQFFLGRLLGGLLSRLFKSRIKVIKKNLSWCFPKAPEIELEKITKQHAINLGIAIFEFANCLYLSDKKLNKQVRISGLENLKKPLNNKTPVILLLGHFTTMLLVGRMLNQVIPIADVYFQPKNKLADWNVRRIFQKHGATMVDNQDMRAMLKVLKQGLPLWYAPDQDFGGKGSVFAPFFNISTATTTATARLAKISKAVVVPLSYKRVAKTYQLNLSPALENYPSNDELEDATNTNKILESQTNEAVSQYFWAHKRFKTRPNNEPNPY